MELPWRAGPPGAPVGGRCLVVTGSFFCVREIELFLALRKHVVIDAVGQRVTWLLPCSKTDPKAIGKSRSWDCVYDKDFMKPCAYHALEDHCELLDTKFSGWPDSDSLPLFPDVTGKAVDKTKVVMLIEHLVAVLGSANHFRGWQKDCMEVTPCGSRALSGWLSQECLFHSSSLWLGGHQTRSRVTWRTRHWRPYPKFTVGPPPQENCVM